MKNLHLLLGLLDTWRGHYTIDTRGSDALVVHANVPAEPTERWEIRLFADGRVEAEVFKSVAIESGDRVDTVFMKLREHPSLVPTSNFICHVPTSDEDTAARIEGMAEAMKRTSAKGTAGH